MIRLRIRFPAFVLRASKVGEGGWIDFEKDVVEGTTVIQLLSDLVMAYPGFREGVFDPRSGTVSEQIGVVLNDRLLAFTEITATRVGQDDSIVILPIYSGG